MPMEDAAPDFLCCFSEPEKITILRFNDPLLDQEIQINSSPPIALANQHDRNWLDLPSLNKSQGFE